MINPDLFLQHKSFFIPQSGTGALHASVMGRTCKTAGGGRFIFVVSKEPWSFLAPWLEAAPLSSLEHCMLFRHKCTRAGWGEHKNANQHAQMRLRSFGYF